MSFCLMTISIDLPKTSMQKSSCMPYPGITHIDFALLWANCSFWTIVIWRNDCCPKEQRILEINAGRQQSCAVTDVYLTLVFKKWTTFKCRIEELTNRCIKVRVNVDIQIIVYIFTFFKVRCSIVTSYVANWLLTSSADRMRERPQIN